MNEIDDMKAESEKQSALIDAQNSVISNVKGDVESLQSQVAALIAAGNDSTELQAVLDGMKAVTAKLSASGQSLSDVDKEEPKGPTE